MVGTSGAVWVERRVVHGPVHTPVGKELALKAVEVCDRLSQRHQL